MSKLKPVTRLAAQRVRSVVLREIERRTKAHLELWGDDFTGRVYRAALADLAGWLDGADVEELLGVDQ